MKASQNNEFLYCRWKMGQLFETFPQNTALQPFSYSFGHIQLCFRVFTFNLFASMHAVLKFYYPKSWGLPSGVVTIVFCFPVIPVKCYYLLVLSTFCHHLDWLLAFLSECEAIHMISWWIQFFIPNPQCKSVDCNVLIPLCSLLALPYFKVHLLFTKGFL